MKACLNQAIKVSVLKEWFPFNVLQKIDGVAMSFTRDDVQMDKLISVREAVKFGSVAGGCFVMLFCKINDDVL